MMTSLGMNCLLSSAYNIIVKWKEKHHQLFQFHMIMSNTTIKQKKWRFQSLECRFYLYLFYLH